MSSQNRDRLVTRLEHAEAYLASLCGCTVAVLGYGNQGRSQALNMRDSGLSVVVGNPPDEYRARAEKDGFEVYDVGEAVKRSDVVFMLIPDEVQPEVFSKAVSPNLKPNGAAVVFASAYNYFYGFVQPPKDVDVLLIAPRMIGFAIRKLYLEGRGFPALIAVARDASGRAEERLLGFTYALGALKEGGVAVRSSFREETLLDLLSEHTWAGAILYLFRAYFEVATELGASPEAAILELYASGELAEVAESMMRQGLFRQLSNHSHTSQYGQLTRGPLFAGEEAKRLIRQMTHGILDGSFAKEWSLEQQAGLVHFRRLLEEALQHPMEKAEEELYRRLGRTG